MRDLVDRFWMKLLNDFGEDLQNTLEHFGEQLSEAIKKNNKPDIDLYLELVNQTRGILDDLADENFDIETFVSLLYEKYPPPQEKKKT